MRRGLADDEVREVLESTPGLGNELISINQDILEKTDFQPGGGRPEDNNFRIVEEWVRDIESTFCEVENLCHGIRSGQINGGDIERKIYEVQEQIDRLIIQEYRETVSDEIGYFSGRGEVFAAENYISDEGVTYFQANMLEMMEKGEEFDRLARETEKQEEGRPDVLDLARAYAELILDYKDEVGEDFGGIYHPAFQDSGR